MTFHENSILYLKWECNLAVDLFNLDKKTLIYSLVRMTKIAKIPIYIVFQFFFNERPADLKFPRSELRIPALQVIIYTDLYKVRRKLKNTRLC